MENGNAVSSVCFDAAASARDCHGRRRTLHPYRTNQGLQIVLVPVVVLPPMASQTADVLSGYLVVTGIGRWVDVSHHFYEVIRQKQRLTTAGKVSFWSILKMALAAEPQISEEHLAPETSIHFLPLWEREAIVASLYFMKDAA